jgi:hypothetical protein
MVSACNALTQQILGTTENLVPESHKFRGYGLTRLIEKRGSRMNFLDIHGISLGAREKRSSLIFKSSITYSCRLSKKIDRYTASLISLIFFPERGSTGGPLIGRMPENHALCDIQREVNARCKN